MKKYLAALTAAAALLAFSSVSMASDIESLAISGAATATTVIDVKKNQNIEIVNFIDENATAQSTIQVTINGVTTRVLQATLSTTAETFKDLQVSGPATITINVPATQFSFVTYKRSSGN
jgi:hypothetical protein